MYLRLWQDTVRWPHRTVSWAITNSMPTNHTHDGRKAGQYAMDKRCIADRELDSAVSAQPPTEHGRLMSMWPYHSKDARE